MSCSESESPRSYEVGEPTLDLRTRTQDTGNPPTHSSCNRDRCADHTEYIECRFRAPDAYSKPGAVALGAQALSLSTVTDSMTTGVVGRSM